MESWCAEVIVELGKQSPDNQVTALLLAALKGMQIPLSIDSPWWEGKIENNFFMDGEYDQFLVNHPGKGERDSPLG